MEEQAESLLRELGLSEYETKACMVLVKFGNSDANKISSIGNIPLPRVYDTMENLAKRGLVSVSKSRPQTFSIINLKRFFEILKIDEKRKIDEKMKNIDEISSKFFKNISLIQTIKPEEEKEDMILFMKRRINVGEIWDEIQKGANKEFLVFAGDLSWINTRANEISKAVKKGIKYKIIWFKSEKEVMPNVKKAMRVGADLRLCDDYSNELRGFISDGKKVYLIQKIPKPGIDAKSLEEGAHWSEEVADYNGIILNSKLMAKVFRDYFYLLWEKSTPAEKFLQSFKK
jgi:sugar-specific transcriptional regulator TrmB